MNAAPRADFASAEPSVFVVVVITRLDEIQMLSSCTYTTAADFSNINQRWRFKIMFFFFCFLEYQRSRVKKEVCIRYTNIYLYTSLPPSVEFIKNQKLIYLSRTGFLS